MIKFWVFLAGVSFVSALALTGSLLMVFAYLLGVFSIGMWIRGEIKEWRRKKLNAKQ